MCRLECKGCNLKQRWDSDKFWCECKKPKYMQKTLYKINVMYCVSIKRVKQDLKIRYENKTLAVLIRKYIFNVLFYWYSYFYWIK